MITLLELKCLGEFELRHADGQAVVISAKKNKALLAALALSPAAALPRERILKLLWSDRGQAQGQASLRQSLVSLRKDLAGLDRPPVVVTDERVSLDVERVKVDALEFQRLAASDDVEALRRAASLYHEDLLSDVDIKDSAFERWLAAERQRLADIAIGVLDRLCESEAGPARIEAAKRLVALDPLREASHRMLMAAYAEAGEKGLAMRQYELCRATLKEELDIGPGAAMEAMRQRLVSEIGTPVRASIPPPRIEAASAAEDKPAIAVLPLSTMGDQSLDHFADGLSEDIITGLSRVKTVRVVARNIMFIYKGEAVDLRVLGRELRARYVLEGSVRRSGARIRVTAQLIESASGHHVWARNFDLEGEDTFDLQDQMTASIVASVQTQIILNEGKPAPAENAASLLARSWQQFLWLTEQSLAESRSLAERAMELEPASGLAHRMLSICLYHQALMGFVPWTDRVIDELHVHAKIAIEAEDADEYSHWAMACAHLLRKEHERGFVSIRRALEINPNCSLAHGSYGTLLAWAGQSEAAIKRTEIAMRMNPDDPSIFYRHLALAIAHYLAAHYEQALAHAGAVVQARPQWRLGLLFRTASLARAGRRKEAARMLAELRGAWGELRPSSLDVLPFASDADRQHFLRGLKEAGLGEPSPARMSSVPRELH